MLLALVVERFRELVEVLLALVQVPEQTMYVCMYVCMHGDRTLTMQFHGFQLYFIRIRI